MSREKSSFLSGDKDRLRERYQIPLIPGENEGFQKIRSVFSPYLESLGSDHTNVTVSHFRSIFKRSWDDILDELVPYEARDRVTREFKSLIF